MFGRLDIQINEEDAITFFIGREACRIGRADDNNLIIKNPNVSSYHAILFWEDKRLALRDLGSKNGTQLNGKFVSKPAFLKDKDHLLLGQSVSCMVQIFQKPKRVSYVVEVIGTSIVFPLLEKMSSICDGYFVEWDEDKKQGRIFDEKEEEIRVLGLGEQCRLISCDIRLIEKPQTLSQTVKKEQSYPYMANIIEHPLFPIVEITDNDSGKKLRFYHNNRAKLLFALICGKKKEESDGWIDDHHLREIIWGEEGKSSRTNNFNVLVHRVREDLFTAGFNGHCLEKKKGFTRLCVEVS